MIPCVLGAQTCTAAAAVWACGSDGAGKASGGGGDVCTSSRPPAPPCAAPATLLLAPAELPVAAAGTRMRQSAR